MGSGARGAAQARTRLMKYADYHQSPYISFQLILPRVSSGVILNILGMIMGNSDGTMGPYGRGGPTICFRIE